jgi:hypothetical protein
LVRVPPTARQGMIRNTALLKMTQEIIKALV